MRWRTDIVLQERPESLGNNALLDASMNYIQELRHLPDIGEPPFEAISPDSCQTLLSMN